MAQDRQIWKVFEGAALVAKEAAESSESLRHLRHGDVQAFLFTSLKTFLNTATDITGLTRGRIRSLSDSPKPRESVVYFPLPKENREHPTEFHENKNAEPSTSLQIESETSNVKSSNAGDAATSTIRKKTGGNSSETEHILQKSLVPGSKSVSLKSVPPVALRRPRERKVPSTSVGRALGFAGLGAGLAWGTLQESAKRLVFGVGSQTTGNVLSPFLSDKNAERLATTLCRMRGAALKIGQMLSIQDESLIPAPLLSALQTVREGADVMPRRQLNAVLTAELGPDWQTKLREFDYEPLAAASIGQVHRAVTRDGMDIAMKIQYPGVAESIDSDIENVRRLLNYTNLIPKGLYLEQAMKVAKVELSRECNYELEAANQKRYRELLSGIDGFYVPMVMDELSSKRVLSTELVKGISLEKVAYLSQEVRDSVGAKLLELTLKELFVFRFMQTDPNWSNFRYDKEKNVINLIDFGAAREYPKHFVDNYLRMVLACANRDKENIIEMSCRLGFLTGMESEIMLDAHTQAALVVGLPFSQKGKFNFKSTNVTSDVSSLGATMLKHRLTPPPDEAYSLHRKLSGAFLVCVKLRAVVPCREMLLDIYRNYSFSGVEEDKQQTNSVLAQA